MNHSQFLVAIPSRTIRKLSPNVLGNFGKTLENNAAAISFREISCPPNQNSPDVVFVDDGNITSSFKDYFRWAAAQQSFIRIAFHSGAECQGHKHWEELRMPHQKVAYKAFHRTDTDPFYSSLHRFCVCIDSAPSLEEYQAALHELILRFEVDWDLESRLNALHEALAPPSGMEIPKDVLLLLNQNSFAEQLRKSRAAESIITSREELERKLMMRHRLLILAELTWDKHRLSQFYGYEIAQEIIARQSNIDLAFVSFLARNQLKSVNAAAQLLVPIFNHYQLPDMLNRIGDITIPNFSLLKWDIIRQYYIRPDGIVDKLVHDIRKINRRSDKARVAEALHRVHTYALILSPEIIDLVTQMQSTLDEELELACKRIKQELLPALEDYYHKTVSTDHGSADMSAYHLMIVEDERDTLRALEEGFRPYFEKVTGFSCGALALAELGKSPRSYSALIVDMELLDSDGNWQSVQGYELIARASAFPHLVTYLLSNYSKRALSVIKSSLHSKEIGYIPKDPILGLPPEVDYASISAKLQAQIQEHTRYLEGPKNGIWKKGLLHFYYAVIASEDGRTLWKDIYSSVDQFLEQGGSNATEMIPKELFSVSTQEFKIHHLRTALIHRLTCLHRQYQAGEIPYERDFKKSIGLSMTSPRQYFNSLLGFSGTCLTEREGTLENGTLKKGDKMHVYRILKKDLFREEKAWLQNKFPHDLTFKYPRLSEILLDATESLPRISRNSLPTLPKTIDSLDDCARVLKTFSRLLGRQKEDIASDLEFYIADYHDEFEQLQRDPEAQQVCKYVLQLSESDKG